MILPLDDIQPKVGRNVFVAPGSHIVGRVELADGVSIWFNCTLRGDLEPIIVGRDTNIQDGCVLHTDAGYPCVIGEEVTVGHSAIVHGARVGNGALIGMGAVVLTGAVIGEGAIVGAGAVVPEGMEIPAGKLALGVPARVIRDVKPEEVKRVQEGVRHYAANRDRFLRQPWSQRA